jgi:molybdate-binding protein
MCVYLWGWGRNAGFFMQFNTGNGIRVNKEELYRRQPTNRQKGAGGRGWGEKMMRSDK